MISKKPLVLALMAVALIALAAGQALAVVIYSNDFSSSVESPNGTWTASSGTPTITTAPNNPYQKFLGTDSSLGISKNTMTLTVSGLSGYSSATVAFDLYIIHSWDGNNNSFDSTQGPGYGDRGPDKWQLVIGGTTYIDTTFSNIPPNYSGYNQSYSDTNLIGLGNFAPKTGNDGISTLTYNDYYGTDTTYKFIFYNVPLNGDTLTIKFIGLPTQGIEDESWGLDNVRVSGVPISPSVLLLGSGLLGLGALGWRRKRGL